MLLRLPAETCMPHRPFSGALMSGGDNKSTNSQFELIIFRYIGEVKLHPFSGHSIQHRFDYTTAVLAQIHVIPRNLVNDLGDLPQVDGR